MSVLGLDLGTSSVKGGLFSSSGTCLSHKDAHVAAGRQAAGLERGVDADGWTRASLSVIRELAAVAAESCPADPIARVCVSGNGPTLIAVDERGEACMEALLWSDRRAIPEAEEISRAAGIRVDPSFYLPKALWIQRNRPADFARVKTFMPCPEYVAFRLSGTPHAVLPSPPYAPFIFSRALIRASGLPPELFPPEIGAAEDLGRLRADIARDTGLPSSCRVVSGLPDFLASLLGAGVVEPGMALDRSGSSEALNLCASIASPDQRLFTLPHAVPGLFNVSGGVSSAGSAYAWLGRMLGYPGGSSLASSPLAAAAAALPPGAEGLIFLPYLEGERAPLWDPLLRGAFAGLSLAHRPEHMLRAVMESIAFALRDVAETMEASRLPVAAIRLSGAPSRNASWNQIKASVLGRELFAPHMSQTEVSGSAALALAVDGRFASVKEAAAALSTRGTSIDPDPASAARYDEPYRRFLDARQALSNPGFRSRQPKASS